MNKSVKDTEKFVKESLGLLDNHYVRGAIVILLVLYIAGVIPSLSAEVSAIFNNTWVRVFFILLILYIGVKDPVLALLIAIAYLLSFQMSNRFDFFAPYPNAFEDDTQGSMDDATPQQVIDANQSTQLQMLASRENFSSGSGSNVDGYNLGEFSSGDCVPCSDDSGNSQCQGVGAFDNEFNPQGFNCPSGYNVDKGGSPAPFSDESS